MTKNKLNWAILGTSPISETMAKAIMQSDQGTLYALGSRSPEHAESFKNQFSIDKIYTDFDSLLNDPNVDAVYIGLPNHLHKAFSLRAIAAKKHLLCEKPFALNLSETLEIFAAAKQQNVFCMEALMYRCHPFTHKIKSLIDQKVIGEIKLIHAFYSAHIADFANPEAGGAIRNLGCYPLSLTTFLLQNRAHVFSATARINSATTDDHQATALFQFDNNVTAVISTADDMEMRWQFDVYGTQGSLHAITNPWYPREENQLLVKHNKIDEIIEIKSVKSVYALQIDTVNQSILSGQQQASDGVSWQQTIDYIELMENWHKKACKKTERDLQYS